MASEPTGTLRARYDTDPLFHALVHLESTGWRDDDGVWHDGPTVADAQRVQRYLDALASLGCRVVNENGAPAFPSPNP